MIISEQFSTYTDALSKQYLRNIGSTDLRKKVEQVSNRLHPLINKM